MTVRLVVDMNLSPDWILAFQSAGIHAVHWSTIGDPRAPDVEIMRWAVANGHIVFTHDLDFGTILALTHDVGPSVIQIRTDDIFPTANQAAVASAIKQYEAELLAGAIMVIEELRNRVRILPL